MNEPQVASRREPAVRAAIERLDAAECAYLPDGRLGDTTYFWKDLR